MKRMYCWRCREAVPMLDEEEFAVVHELLARAIQVLKSNPGRINQADFKRDQYRPVLEAYRKFTGEIVDDPFVLMHHRISKYGPPCSGCGKPLRTPKAAYCAACGRSVV